MKILGLNITKSTDLEAVAVRSQLRDTSPQGPLTSSFNNWVFRKIDPKFFEVMREAIPMCDTAINKLVSMNGRIEIIGEKADCVAELEDFCMSVPVGPVQHGIDAYRGAMWGEGFEQGFGYGELMATPDLKDIEGLRVADSKYIIYWRNADGVPEPWYLYPDKDPNNNRPLIDPAELIGKIVNARYGQTLNYNQQDMVKLNPANKFYLAPRVENGNPYGIAQFRSIPWVAQILATLQNSIKNSADRFGSPSYHLHSSGKTASDKIKAMVEDLTTQLANAISIKSKGGNADIVTAGGEASKVDIKIIGHEGQLFEYEIPLKHAEESIVAASGLPAWVLGKYWSTTERMAQMEVEIALADASGRNTNETPGLIRLFSAVLAMRGKKWKTITLDPNGPGDWGFRFIQPNLHNRAAEAQANFLDAQADMMRRGGGTAGAPVATVRNQGTEVPVGNASTGMVTIKSEGVDIQVPLMEQGNRVAVIHPKTIKPKGGCSCGKHADTVGSIQKELQRPFPWPKLDEYEQRYEQELKHDWTTLREKVFKIADLKDPAVDTSDKSNASYSSKAFTYTDAQRKAVMDALKEYLGWYEPSYEDSSVTWYYGQAYSLGLIQAANMVGKERPILDLIKNKEIFDELVANGFDLVKNNATLAIQDEAMMVMQNGMEQGVNPRDVARDLAEIFDDKNSDWERLARTEMSGAAVRAKHDEWDERGVDVSAMLKPDQSNQVPVHPRCRCDYTIVDDGNGNLRAVFAPAPDACPWCLSLQEGEKAARHRVRNLGGKRTLEWYQKWAEQFGEARPVKLSKLSSSSASLSPLPSEGEGRVRGGSDQSYEKITAALEKIADRPINIKIEQGEQQFKFIFDKTSAGWEMEKDPKTGKVRMNPITQERLSV